MASLKLLFSLVVLTSVLSIQASYPSFEDNGVNVLESKKVNLSLYYETLCPSCASFIVNELAATLFDPEGDLVSIVNLRLVPYGNAQVKAPNKTIVCQHGPDECYFNSIEACAIHLWSDVKRHFKFIHCLESKLIEGLHSSKEYAWESCCVKLEMDSDRLGKCYRSGYEKKLILENAKETDHLVPPHEYVPWVVVNGQPLKDDYLNFVRYVCNAYKDSPKPKACRSYQHNINSGGKANSSLEGCYKGDQNAGGAETLQ
ncbi:gamma-interferon-responsive lysosomal thiol protein isoform X1 [Rosa chinensis]|uniref:gamma-interferon-responsive lysosomal thiol protein isoform X1 n=1 Tax=Rosa chinensis TaxID=74649 RepID=UPI000D097BF6|nr:gamma-interferon-responsive lysosomal thiol protein isoform X1 [Rosa chinensis]